jgi:hypothetical protein
MEGNPQGPAGVDHAAKGGRIGRVRIVEEEGFPTEAAVPQPEEGGWSPQALALGFVALLVIIGALLLILWGSFQV